MPRVLICTRQGEGEELRPTLIWREDVQRQVSHDTGEAFDLATSDRPNLVIVDSALGGAEKLITELRRSDVTRGLSIVVMAGGDLDPAEVRLLDAGANAILRLPASPEWDDRLSPLISVPRRRAGRLAVTLQFEANSIDGITTVGGTVLNVSEHGMLIETDVSLALGTDIDFKIHLRDRPQPLVGCGQVVRHEAARRAGVRFYGLEGDGPERIQRFVLAGLKP
jgi:DNA-binding response OmpR family regulator